MKTNQKILTVIIITSATFFLCFSPGLLSGFTLIDDSTLNRTIYRWFNSEQGFFSLLYRSDIQGGARYTPSYWIVKASLLKVFGYNPFYHHLVHLLFSWIPLCGIPAYFAVRKQKCSIAFLPLVFFLIFSGTGWGSQLWNLYDISTYDPLGAAFLSLSILFLDLFLKQSSRAQKIIAICALAMSLIIAANAKETIALGILVSGVFFFVLWMLSKKKEYLILSFSAGFASVIFAIGYIVSGANSMRSVNDYTSTYDININTILSNVVFTFSHQFTLSGFTLLLLLIISSFGYYKARHNKAWDESSSSFTPLIILFFLALIFSGVQLPITLLKDQPRFLFTGIIFLSYFAAAVMFELPNIFISKNNKYIIPTLWIILLLPALFIPFRILTFNSIYSSTIKEEWKAVEYCKYYLSQNPETQIEVFSPESESFYWGLFIHLENLNLSPDQQLILMKVENQKATLRHPSIILLRNTKIYLENEFLTVEDQRILSLPSEKIVWTNTDFRYFLNWIKSGRRESLRHEVFLGVYSTPDQSPSGSE